MGKKNVFLAYFMAVVFLLRAGVAGADPVIQISDPSADMSQSQTCILKGRITDSTGAAAPVDIHAGVVLPDGIIYELDYSFTFQPLDLTADPSLSHPLSSNLTLNAGTDSGEVELFRYQFTGNELAGVYIVFVAITDTSTLNVTVSATKSFTPKLSDFFLKKVPFERKMFDIIEWSEVQLKYQHFTQRVKS